MQRVMAFVPLGILGVIGFFLLAGQLGASKQDVMPYSRRQELLDAVKFRVAAYRSDDGWREAMAKRRGAISEGACTEAKDAPVAEVTEGGELPLQSGRTTEVLARIAIEEEIKAAKGSQYAPLRERIAALQFPRFDILLEIERETAHAYVYDHDKRVIVCVESGSAKDLPRVKVADRDADSPRRRDHARVRRRSREYRRAGAR